MESFAHGLRTAIRLRGLTLDEVQRRLADRGVLVSSVTLSYWSRGRSQPERAESLRAVGLLEGILDVPTGALVGLLAPPRPRGPRRAHVPVSVDRWQLWDQAHRLDTVLAKVGSLDDERLCLLFVHDRLEVDDRHRPVRITVTEVLRAQRDRADRALFIFHTGEEGGHTPEPSVLRGGTLGRVRTDEDAGFVVSEVLFDRLLDRDETIVVEFALTYVTGIPPSIVEYDRRLPHPVRQYLLEVDFHPHAVPVRCYETERPTIDVQRRDLREVTFGGAARAHRALFDVGAGIHGLRWEWD